MAPLKAGALFAAACLSFATYVSAEAPRVVPMKIQRREGSSGLVRRQAIEAPIQNYQPIGEYFATVEVGTPPQTLELVLDTGSSDIWFFAPGACNPRTAGGACEGGSFDSSSSSTFNLLQTGTFQIRYVTAGSGVQGNYISDTFGIAGISVTNLTMAVATKATQTNTGIMGIGLDSGESIVNTAGAGAEYPNLADTLVAQNKISSKSYSLYLDDLSTAQGTLIFGGYDEDKFEGDLIMMPLQEDVQSGTKSSFSVAWTGLAITDSHGTSAVEYDALPLTATLDSGTTLIYVPTQIYQYFVQYFNAEENETVGAIIPCDVGDSGGSVEFSFGGPDGPVIAVPFAELARPLYNPTTGDLETQSGSPVCQLGMQDAGDSPIILFGQTFLRSAYVMYDLENLAAGLAQTKFAVSSSNLKEYDAGSSNDQITTDTSGPTVSLAAQPTVLPSGVFSGLSSFVGSQVFGSAPTGDASLNVVQTSLQFTVPTAASETIFPTHYGSLSAVTGAVAAATDNSGSGGQGSGNAAASSSSGAAAAGVVPPLALANWLVGCGSLAMMLLGGMLLL